MFLRIAAWMLVFLLAGCVANDPAASDEAQDADGSADAAPATATAPVPNGTQVQAAPIQSAGIPDSFHTSYFMHDCEHHTFAFHVPLSELNVHLEEGFVAAPMEQFYVPSYTGEPLPGLPADSGMGLAIAVIHPCQGAPWNGPVHATLYWILIEEPAAAQDIPDLAPGANTNHVYQVFLGAQGPQADLWASLGSDRTATIELQSQGSMAGLVGLSASSSISVQGLGTVQTSIDEALPTGSVIAGLFHVWMPMDSGLLWLATGYTEEELPSHATTSVTCSWPDDHPFTDLIGASTCADAVSRVPLGIINEQHDHTYDVEVVWHKGWTGGPLEMPPMTPWQDHILG